MTFSTCPFGYCTYPDGGAPDMLQRVFQRSSQWVNGAQHREQLQQIDPAGQHSFVEYDIRNNITATTDPGGFRTEMRWDANHNLLELTNALGQTTRMSYDTKNNLVMAVNALGETTQLSYDERSNLLQVIDNIGHRSNAAYDDNGLLTSVTNNQGISWTFAYDNLGFLRSKTVPGTSAGQAATSWYYLVDSLGRTLRKQDPLGRVYNAKYDQRDRLVEATVPAVSGRYRQEAQCSRSILQTYDNWDRLRASTELDGKVTRYDYDDCEQLTAVYQPGYPRPIRMKYDSFENLLEMTNAANQTTRYRYDILNRVVETTYPNADSETFAYDRWPRFCAATDILPPPP